MDPKNVKRLCHLAQYTTLQCGMPLINEMRQEVKHTSGKKTVY